MVFLDTNVVMEVLEKRSRWQLVQQVLRNVDKHETTAVSTLTISTVFYLYEKRPEFFTQLERYFKAQKIVPVDDIDVSWAFRHYAQDDLEDALQVAAAIHAGCTLFLTLDAKLAKKYAQQIPIHLIR